MKVVETKKLVDEVAGETEGARRATGVFPAGAPAPEPPAATAAETEVVAKALLHASDVFVLPSRHEGLSLAYLEALASGLPVIASRIEANREVDPLEQATVFFDSESEASLSDALVRLLDDGDLRMRLASNAGAVVARFALSEVGKQYEAMYEAARRHNTGGALNE